VADQQAEHLAEGVRGEGGSRSAGLFPPDLLTVGLENLLALAAQLRDLLFGEAIGQKNVALVVEGFELRGGEFHGGVLFCRRGERLALFLLPPWVEKVYAAVIPVEMPLFGHDAGGLDDGSPFGHLAR
jgi:hypothetical protein